MKCILKYFSIHIYWIMTCDYFVDCQKSLNWIYVKMPEGDYNILVIRLNIDTVDLCKKKTFFFLSTRFFSD
jgi:hypothetical protein